MAKNPSQPPSKSGVLPGTPAGEPRKGPGILPGTPDDALETDGAKTSRPPRS
jgi:hypothetical protein